MQWVPDRGRRRGRPTKTWQQTFQEDLQEMRVVFAEWQVIGVGGKVLSSNAPAGVGGSKSLNKVVPIKIWK